MHLTNGGSPITDYSIEWSFDGNAPWTPFIHPDSPATSIVVDSLINGQEYYFHVAAINSAGTGLYTLPLPATPNPTLTLEVRVSDNDDDAEEKVSNGKVKLDSSDLELTEDSSEQIVGMRFNEIIIPPTATITSAYVQFTTDSTDDDETNLTIFAEKTGNSAAFVDVNDNISDRTKTTAFVSWSSIPEWDTSGEAGDNQRTPDIKAVIQEVIGTAGWNNNNSLSIIITGTGVRTAESYDGAIDDHNDPTRAPLLVIEYTVPLTAPTAPISLAATAGNTEVTLNWTAPYNGGSSITEYKVQYKLTSANLWSDHTPSVTTTTATIPGLTNDSSYDFRVAAINAIDQGPYTNPVSATPTAAITVVIEISSSHDDAEEGEYDSEDPGDMSLSSSDLDLDEEDYIGLRFNLVPISQGVTITDAYVQFTHELDDGSAETGTASVTIYAEAEDNPGTFTSTPFDISDRTPTTNFATWTIPDWPIPGESNDVHKTSQLKTIIQEIIDREFWNVNNSIVLVFEANTPNNGNDRDAESYNGVSAHAPKLYISYSDVVTVPSKPLNLIATSGDTEVSLSWATPSSNGGALITDYFVEFSDDEGDTWESFAHGDSSTVETVTGLINAQPYVFRVSAINSAGTGPASDPPASAILAGVPGQPTITSAVPGDTQVLLTWTIPANNGATITDYIIHVDYNDNNGFVPYPFDIVSPDNTDIPVTGLINDISHSFIVKAVNSAGDGIFSIAISATPTPAATAPFLHTATSDEDSRVFVSWNPPTSTGGFPITSYKIEYSTDGTFDNTTPFKTVSGNPPPDELIVTPLQNGQQYTFRVTAFNSANAASPPSNVLTATPSTIPNTPVINDLLTETGNSYVYLEWTPTFTGGSPLIDYIIEFKPPVGIWETVNDGINLDTSITVNGLGQW